MFYSSFFFAMRRKGEYTLKFQHIYRKISINFIDFSKNLIIIIFRMDMRIDKSKADAVSLAKLGSHKCVVGAKQIRKALSSGSASFVFLAKNADPAITEPLLALCQHNCVEFTWVKSMTDLGQACGIEVGAAAAAIVA